MVNNWPSFIKELEARVIDGKPVSLEQARKLIGTPDDNFEILLEAARNIRRTFHRDNVDLCSIINARSGRCPEDCKFCAQSSRHDADTPTYPIKSVAEIVTAAKISEARGVHRFCIVTSGADLSDRDFDTVLEATARIKTETNLKRCASVGKLTSEHAKQLKEAGLNRYHHNIETAPSFFADICTTHSFADKTETIGQLKENGIETCVGGILNMGESPAQRLEFAFALQAIDPVSVPINFLNPRPGTPLADQPLISAAEAAKYLAIFRFILPKALIRLAGGRLETFAENQSLPFAAGVNALLVGDLLTTKGPNVATDLELLSSLGLTIDSDNDEF